MAIGTSVQACICLATEQLPETGTTSELRWPALARHEAIDVGALIAFCLPGSRIDARFRLASNPQSLRISPALHDMQPLLNTPPDQPRRSGANWPHCLALQSCGYHLRKHVALSPTSPGSIPDTPQPPSITRNLFTSDQASGRRGAVCVHGKQPAG